MDDELDATDTPGSWRADESTLYFSAHSWDYVGLHNQSLAREIAKRHNAELEAAREQRATHGRSNEVKTISQDDYLRLVGLLTLAADHRKALDDINRSACALTGEAPGHHTTDTIWGGYQHSADDLLHLLGITVEQPSTTPEQAGEQMGKAMDITRRFNDP